MQVITDAGLNAIANADVSGFLLSVDEFAVTETKPDALTTDTALAGTAVYRGKVDVVEVVSSATVRFTFTLPIDLPATGFWSLQELGIYLADGTLFSHGALEPVYEKTSDFGIRFYVYVSAARLGDVINVSASTVNSLPSIAYVHSIPPAKDIFENALVVLDEWENPDGSSSPSVAIKYGAGSKFIGYIGYDRIYYGKVDSIGADGNFYINSDEGGFVIVEGERVLVQEVVGGNLRSHKYQYAGNDLFEHVDGTPAIDTNTMIAVWKRTMPLVGTGYRFSIEVENLVTDTVGAYTLGFTPQNDSTVFCWASGLFQGTAVAGRSVSLQGLPPGKPIKVLSIRKDVTNGDQKPHKLTVIQKDFEAHTDTALPLDVTPIDRNHVLVFKSGLLVPDTDWTLVNRDVLLANGLTANGELFSVIVLDVVEAKKGFRLRTASKQVFSGGLNQIFVDGLKVRNTSLFISGLLQQRASFNLLPGQLNTVSIIEDQVPVDIRQVVSEANGYMFAMTDDMESAVTSIVKDNTDLVVTTFDGASKRLKMDSGPYIFGFPTACLEHDVVTYGVTGGYAYEEFFVTVLKDGVELNARSRSVMDVNGYWCATASVQTAGVYQYQIEFPAHGLTIIHDGTVYPGNSYTATRTIASSVGTGTSLVKDNDTTGIKLKSVAAGANISLTESPDGTLTIAAGSGSGGSGSSLINNIGNGVGIYAGDINGAQQLRALKAGANVSIAVDQQSGAILIDAVAAGTGGGSTAGLKVFSGQSEYVGAAHGTPIVDGVGAVIPIPAGYSESQCTFFWATNAFRGTSRGVKVTWGQRYDGAVANLAYLIFVKE